MISKAGFIGDIRGEHMEKCFITYCISNIPRVSSSYFDKHVYAVTETKEDALDLLKNYNIADIFPRGYTIYFLIQDFPFGKNRNFMFEQETLLFKYTKNGMMEIDWKNIPDDDKELSEIYLQFARN